MKDFSILIGGRSGDGIDSSAPIIAKIFNQYGYYIHIYRDYPSLIRGGHTFSIVRVSKKLVGTYRDKVDVILALNQDCVAKHKERISKDTLVIYDKGQVKSEGEGIDLTQMAKDLGMPPIIRNTGLIGAMCKTFGISWSVAEKVIKNNTPKKINENLKIAKEAFDKVEAKFKTEKLKRKSLPMFSGNEAVAYGLTKAGLDSYIAYPMTPASSILHTLAAQADNLGLKVVHAESEIGVMLMANGAAYAGDRVAVGTSGGGFCLMTEGISLAGMGEFPVAIVMSQRSGPASGVPTYNAQADLHFVLNSGHGEFVRIVVAPADAEQSYYWSGVALNLAWKYQTPSFILIDKAVSESVFTFNPQTAGRVSKEKELLWNKKGEYRRYKNTRNGVSPLAFPGDKKAIVKGTSYEHDEYGVTIEDSTSAVLMQEKRLRKETYLLDEIEKKYEAIKVYGNKKSKKALICWGSNAGLCREVAGELNIKAIQPIVLSPMPVKQLERALSGVEELINVETNATAQMATLLKQYGVQVNDIILKYDSRPFSVEELTHNVKKVMK